MKTKLFALVTMACSLAYTARVQAQIINTVAGTGSAGYSGDGSAATAAQLNDPAGIASDTSGNIYIADYSNNVVRMINASTGVISTIAGTGSSGYSGDGSTATSANLSGPVAVAVNQSNGDIYIADRTNNCIRKVTASTGIISTIAGTGTSAHTGDGGAATSADLAGPTDLKLNSSNSKLYIGCLDHTIRMIDLSTGVISNIAGTADSSGSSGDGGLATAAIINTPYLGIDHSNNLYLADHSANLIRKIDASTGIITTVAGTGTSGHSGDGSAATAANINGPQGISFDEANNLYFSELSGQTIRKIDGAGIITTIAGTGTSGFSGDGGDALSATMSAPWGILVKNRKLTFSDSGNDRLRSIALCRTVIYVDSSATASGSGDSWSSPFKTLTEALDTANAGGCAVQIWVKKGTYFPGTDRDSSFRITRNNIKVYGGFAGTETALSGRSVSSNPTILSGDIGTTGDSTDNNYHVMTIIGTSTSQIDTNTTVDGFTICYGNSNGAGSFTYGSTTFNQQDGAGILIYGGGSGNSCSPIIANCSITHNTANFGGGIYAAGFNSGNSSPILRSNQFTFNTANNNGGGLFANAQISGNNATYVEKCTFSGNQASNGGGIYFQASSGTLVSTVTQSTFDNNNATTAGGGVQHNGNSKVTYTNNVFSNNTSASGAGVYSSSSDSVSYTSCRFSGNTATTSGGAIRITDGTSAFARCVFNNNKSSDVTNGAGGAIAADAGNTTLNNCVFSGNTASGTSSDGGGAIKVAGGTLNLQSTTMSENSSASTVATDANTVSTLSGSTVSILNTIIWGAAATHVSTGGTVNFTNALVRGATLTAPSISSDPRFTNPSTPAGADGIWLTTDDGLNLLPCSPAINVASSAAPSSDILNRTRLGLPDMGAYEEQGASLPLAPLVTDTIRYCQGATVAALTATASSSTDTLKWYDASLTLLSGAPTPSTATAGTTTYYVSQTAASGCEGPKATITIIINPTPAAPVASTPIVYCQNATAAALTATLTSDTLVWYDASSAMLSAAPTPSTATAGTYTWYVSQKTSVGCESPKTTITVTINPTPASPVTTTAIAYCQGATATSLSATLSSDTLKWYDNTPSLLSGAPTPVTTTVGTYTWYVSQINTLGCESPKKTIIVTVNPTPGAPAATTSFVYCQNATATALTATLSPGSDTLKWYDASSAPLSGAPIPSTATAGTYTWYVSQKTSAGCEGPKTTITVTINPTPAAPVAPSPVSYCMGATATALSATLTSDTLKWYDATPSLLGAAPTPATTTVGTYTWYVSQINTLGCESPKRTITVNINAIPVAPTATTSFVYCQNATVPALTATKATATDTLKWYDASSTLLSGAPTPSTSTPGTYTWYVSAKSSAGCEGPKTSISVTINPTPASPTTTTPITYCQNATASVLTATLSGAADTMKWYNSTSTLLSGAPTPSTSTAGTFTWSVSETNSYGCESPKKTITVTVNPTPAAPAAVTPVVYCQDDAAVALSATKASATDTLKWYNSSSSLLGATAPVPSTSTPGTYSWMVSDKTALGCEGPKSTITVTVNPKPAAPTVVTPIDLCVGIPAAALSATGTNLKWYVTALGGGSSATLTPSTATSGTFTYYVSQTNALGCEGPRTGLTVNVRPSPIVTISPRSMPAFVFCIGDSVVLQASSATAVAYQWLQSGVYLPGSTRDTFTASTTASYGVIVKDIYGCADTESVYVMENPLPKPSLSPTDALFCPGTTVMLYANPNTTGYRYDWYKDNILMGVDTSYSSIPVGVAGIYHIIMKDIYTCVTKTNFAYVSTYPAITKPEIVQTGTSLKTKIAYSSYQWYRNGKIIPGATSRIYNISFDGTYQVVVQDANGCEGTSDPLESNVLKVDEQSLSAIHLYPNPTTSRVQIDAAGKVDVLITDFAGRQVQQLKQVTEVDLSTFSDGLYMFRISDKDGKLLLIEKVNKISGQ